MVTTDNVQLDAVTMHLHSMPSSPTPSHHHLLVYISQIVNWQLTYSQTWYALNQWVYKCFKWVVLALTLILAVSIQVKTGCCLWSSHLCLSTRGYNQISRVSELLSVLVDGASVFFSPLVACFTWWLKPVQVGYIKLGELFWQDFGLDFSLIQETVSVILFNCEIR